MSQGGRVSPSPRTSSIAFRPSGLHCAIGFNDKIRLAHLLVDDLRVYKEINVKQCRKLVLGGRAILCGGERTAVCPHFYDGSKFVIYAPQLEGQI